MDRTKQFQFILIIFLSLILAACASSPKTDSKRTLHSKDNISNVAKRDLAVANDYLRSREFTMARNAALKAEVNSPKSSEVQLMLGVIENYAGNPDKASKRFENAVKLGPNNPGALNAYGVLLCRQGKYGEADILFRRAILIPNNVQKSDAMLNGGLCLINAGQIEKALGYLRSALPSKPQNPTLLAALADASFRHGDSMSARAFLQRRESIGALDIELIELGLKIEQHLGDKRAIKRYQLLLDTQQLNKEVPTSNFSPTNDTGRGGL